MIFFNKHTIFHYNKLKQQQNDINTKRYTRVRKLNKKQNKTKIKRNTHKTKHKIKKREKKILPHFSKLFFTRSLTAPSSKSLEHNQRRGAVVITTAQLYSTKPELKFCAGSNPAHDMSEICNGEDF